MGKIERKTGVCRCGKAISRRAKACGTHRDTTLQSGINNVAWKGDAVGYVPLHSWVARKKGKPKLCEHCGTTKAKRFEWANMPGTYKRILSDWARLCPRCHHKHDQIAKRGWITRRKNVYLRRKTSHL